MALLDFHGDGAGDVVAITSPFQAQFAFERLEVFARDVHFGGYQVKGEGEKIHGATIQCWVWGMQGGLPGVIYGATGLGFVFFGGVLG